MAAFSASYQSTALLGLHFFDSFDQGLTSGDSFARRRAQHLSLE
jgi:hypothetical protein